MASEKGRESCQDLLMGEHVIGIHTVGKQQEYSFNFPIIDYLMLGDSFEKE